MPVIISRRALLQIGAVLAVAPALAFRGAKRAQWDLLASIDFAPEYFDGPYYNSFAFIRTDVYDLVVKYQIDSSYLTQPLFVRVQAEGKEGEYLSAHRIESMTGVVRFKVGTWGHDGEQLVRIAVTDEFGNPHSESPIIVTDLPGFSSDGEVEI